VIGAQGATTKLIKAVNFGEEYNIKETCRNLQPLVIVTLLYQISLKSVGTKSEVKVLSKEGHRKFEG
jgi:hypothetical protein